MSFILATYKEVILLLLEQCWLVSTKANQQKSGSLKWEFDFQLGHMHFGGKDTEQGRGGQADMEQDPGDSHSAENEELGEQEEKQLTFESFVKEATELLRLLDAWSAQGTHHLATQRKGVNGDEGSSSTFDSTRCADFHLQMNFKRIVEIVTILALV